MRRHSEFSDASSLFTNSDPAAVLEFYDSLRRSSYVEPEKRLMLAVLVDAVKCLQKHNGDRSRRGRTLFNETELWFWNEDEEDIFSFAHVCGMLGLSPDYFRRMLDQRSAPAQNHAGLPPAKARRRLRHAA